MGRFRFCMIGTGQAPVIDVDETSLREICETIDRHRFLLGRLIEIDGYGTSCGVLIPTSRIQMICEVEQ